MPKAGGSSGGFIVRWCRRLSSRRSWPTLGSSKCLHATRSANTEIPACAEQSAAASPRNSPFGGRFTALARGVLSAAARCCLKRRGMPRWIAVGTSWVTRHSSHVAGRSNVRVGSLTLASSGRAKSRPHQPGHHHHLARPAFVPPLMRNVRQLEILRATRSANTEIAARAEQHTAAFPRRPSFGGRLTAVTWSALSAAARCY